METWGESIRVALAESGRLQGPGLPPSDPSFATEFPLRILIADHSYISRRVIVIMLQRLGYQPNFAEDGFECLQTALRTTHDVILMAIDMPEMDGVECATCLRKIGLDTPIFAIGPDESQATLNHCRLAGMDGCLPRPVPCEDLKQILRAAHLHRLAAFRAEHVPGA